MKAITAMTATVGLGLALSFHAPTARADEWSVARRCHAEIPDLEALLTD